MRIETRPEAAAAAVAVELHSGFPDAIDDSASAADPRHHFLRRAWFAAEPADGSATLVARRPDGRVVAALPVRPVGPRLLGLRSVAGPYWPFRSFPIAEDCTGDELAAFLSAPEARRALGPAWRLGPVLEDDPSLVRMLRAAALAGLSPLRRGAGTAYLLDIGPSEESEPWPRTSTRRNLRTHEKRLAKLGALQFEYVTGGGWSDEVLGRLAQVEGNAWVASREGADPKFLDPVRRKAWSSMIADPALAQMLGAGILSIDGEPVSFSFGLGAGGTRFCIATSYDQRFARHSPGYVTGYRTYIEAAARGTGTLNLGTGDSGAKQSMGAAPGAEMVDYLFVRSALLRALLAPFWR